ncbi:MAG: TetR family transcriptional regulator [Ferrovum sp. 37-45-19]|jgi:TetR/AcrR family transcriptional repressor of nem operon|uniref:TetR/AcrR family transcriptional regulator n=1 Tax=Ferrovum sp. JA12 TaxID=1356299 RepID=UPI0007035F16|nr:TetR/AcrR family transcriptional regulator [Ferrovum sp. JA12]OYV80558.1 MAG: TetR family transcriptional regulator [Ferrovum sp. 21-44-67]OYV94873.1 MAG: TetR family transcriptional regulator [Ferrovum sp. 37-45-19]OZB34094.1 MAG: TetR family transcriptional regulator [Ferrovum sp. 34-44-207]HQT80994.1 TetR/AcrR family transcriptional regulator [Ferrovaceae bacterium]KRH79281.1 HTH-type transcriptional repressor ComR [Ferrovum sp. JA12]
MGRHAQFKRQEVIDKAAKTFWDLGFYATRMTDLIASTKLQPGSLYAAFDSKDALFLECIDSYGQQLLSNTELLLAQRSPKQAIINYFDYLVEEASTNSSPHGCLLVNSLLELSRLDQQVKGLVEKYLLQMEQLFESAINEAISLGEISTKGSPKELATTLMVCIWGMRVLCETSQGRDKVSGVAHQMLKLLDL